MNRSRGEMLNTLVQSRGEKYISYYPYSLRILMLKNIVKLYSKFRTFLKF